MAAGYEFGTFLQNQLCKQLSLEVQSRDLKEKLWAEDSTLDQLIAKCQLHEQINATRDLIEVRSRDVNAFDRRTFKKKPDRGTFGQGPNMQSE